MSKITFKTIDGVRVGSDGSRQVPMRKPVTTGKFTKDLPANSIAANAVKMAMRNVQNRVVNEMSADARKVWKMFEDAIYRNDDTNLEKAYSSFEKLTAKDKHAVVKSVQHAEHSLRTAGSKEASKKAKEMLSDLK